MSGNEIGPRLYLVAPGDLSLHSLEAALDAGDVACLLLRAATAHSRRAIAAAQERGVAALVADDVELARRVGADGVHLQPGGSVESARRRLGDDVIVGAACGHSRHAALLAAEAGADYVAFAGREDDAAAAADPALLEWWQALMTVPCVAMGRIELADVRPLAEAGADFTALDSAVWRHPDGPASAVADAVRRLSEAGSN